MKVIDGKVRQVVRRNADKADASAELQAASVDLLTTLVDEVQPVVSTWLDPRRSNFIDSSLLSAPGVDEGIAYRLTAFGSPR